MNPLFTLGEEFRFQTPADPARRLESASKHLASYLDGTPKEGLLLHCTEENQCIFDGWRDDELVSEEIPIPADRSEARFNIEAFSDSSWADCKSTRKSTSSGLVFLNGAMILSICRTQASVALSSCEAELFAAHGLMVECMYLYRLCKFLCKDDLETNSCDIQQRLYIDSSSAMALIQRAGTGRLKHVQIEQFSCRTCWERVFSQSTRSTRSWTLVTSTQRG